VLNHGTIIREILMPESNQLIETELQGSIQKSSGLIIATGILLLLLGLFAMGSPLVAGLSLALMVGIMLIFGGIGQMFFAFNAGKGPIAFVLGLLTLVIGIYMVSRPGAALASLTLFLAMYLIISGAFEVMMSFQFRPIRGWWWAMFSGIVSMLLGFMIWNQFPLSGAWAIGILIGIRLFFNGLTFLMLGLASRQL
jgi:uncharacterized membrane protein HdeD (DUF308 family)